MEKFRERFKKFVTEGEFVDGVLNDWVEAHPDLCLLDIAYNADRMFSEVMLVYNHDDVRARRTNTGLQFVEMTEIGMDKYLDEQINEWREKHPKAQICEILYSRPEKWSVLIMYREKKNDRV